MNSHNTAHYNSDVSDYKTKDHLISLLKKRFYTYHYKQVQTPTFEDYDMYATITQTVNKDEMVKVIDRTGKVLVLRPDGTIPITRMTTLQQDIEKRVERLFYVLNVYRNAEEENTNKENTQAGIELFGNKTPEADAEVIAVAIHTLKDIGFNNFKIEIGHAGLFKELVEQANLSAQDFEELQELIHSKNMVEMEPFLKRLNIHPDLEQALRSIPLLYGNPDFVLEQTEKIIQNEKMQQILEHLTKVMEVIKDYGMQDAITLNLGLINNMNYYTDIIFQGFVENTGKPVLMGGRYDQLGKELGKAMPAVGFAYEVDALLEAMAKHELTNSGDDAAPIEITYVTTQRQEALQTATSLRNAGFTVTASKNPPQGNGPVISFTTDETSLKRNDDVQTVSNIESLIELLSTVQEVKHG